MNVRRSVLCVLLVMSANCRAAPAFDDASGTDSSCVISRSTRVVRGQSLAGVFEEGAVLDVALGFYSCNRPKRGDVVLWSHRSRSAPLAKIVAGIPGDRLEIRRVAGESILWLNGAALMNTRDAPFTVSALQQRMLEVYLHSYRNVIPDDGYLLLSNRGSGSVDGRDFGLASVRDLTGKVIQRL